VTGPCLQRGHQHHGSGLGAPCGGTEGIVHGDNVFPWSLGISYSENVLNQGTISIFSLVSISILSRDHHKWRFLKCGYPHIIKKIIGFFVVNHRLWGTPNLRNPQISRYQLEPFFLRICLYSQDGEDGAEEPTEDL
jgi:hypothetical protein